MAHAPNRDAAGGEQADHEGRIQPARGRAALDGVARPGLIGLR